MCVCVCVYFMYVLNVISLCLFLRVSLLQFYSVDYFHKCRQSSCSWTEATYLSSPGKVAVS